LLRSLALVPRGSRVESGYFVVARGGKERLRFLLLSTPARNPVLDCSALALAPR
jgi:hypothetical protein